MNVDRVRLDAHPTKLRQGSLALPHNRALESDKHEQGEDRVVPVFIETPQADTEQLEDEERRHSVLLEQLAERRDGDVERVETIVVGKTGDFLFALETAGELVVGKFGTSIDGVDERRERSVFGVVEETALLEQERDLLLVASL